MDKTDSKKHPRVSDRQLQWLERLIWLSRDGSEFTRKLLIWMIRQTQGLTIEVEVTVAPEVDSEIHDMGSDNCGTHIDQLLSLAGSDMLVYRCGGPGIAIHSFMDYKCTAIKLTYDEADINDVVPSEPHYYEA